MKQKNNVKLRNKKTCTIINFKELFTDELIIDLFSKDFKYFYSKLNEIIEVWEVYEEPNEYYFIRSESLTIGYSPITNTRSCRNRKEIGNYFETKEEAELAVRKLKAWKRLRDKKIRFIYDEADYETGYPTVTCAFGSTYREFTKIINDEIRKDLELLFGVGDTNVTKTGGGDE